MNGNPDDDVEEWSDFWDDCGLDDDGQCSKAGSEDCDFECPYRNTKFFAGNPGFKPRRKRKKAEGRP